MLQEISHNTATTPSKDNLIKLPCPWYWGLGSSTEEIREQIELASNRDIHVVIVGETGTGKEIVARTLYDVRRKKRGLTMAEAPFVPVNVTTIPESLAESILFGHERGAFTSARERQIGKFEIAKRGTLFLDEIQSLRFDLQSKLLRVLQTGEIDRLGSRTSHRTHCQVIAATNVPLELMLKEKTFRRDLYYRLNVCPIYLTALRHRRNDLPLLIKGLQQRILDNFRVEARELSAEAFEKFLTYDWPGNLRELEHALLYASLRTDSKIHCKHLPPHIIGKTDEYLKAGNWS